MSSTAAASPSRSARTQTRRSKSSPPSSGSCGFRAVRRSALGSRSVKRQQGNVVFLLPLFSGKALQLGQQRIDQRRTTWVCIDKPLHSWNTKHLTARVVSLDQPIAIEEDAISRLERDLLLLVAHVGHQAQRHAGSP